MPEAFVEKLDHLALMIRWFEKNWPGIARWVSQFLFPEVPDASRIKEEYTGILDELEGFENSLPSGHLTLIGVTALREKYQGEIDQALDYNPTRAQRLLEDFRRELGQLKTGGWRNRINRED
jgi:hypothetical protein